MHSHQICAAAAGGDARGAADERLAFRAAGECDHDAFACLPGFVDAVLGAVPVELIVDLVG
jgi:hypothetical protein